MIIALGAFPKPLAIRLAVLAQEAQLELQLTSDSEALLRWLDLSPSLVLIDTTTPDLQRVCGRVRAHPQGRHVALFCVAPEVEDLAFGSALVAGADDVVSLQNPRGLLIRLRRVTRATPTPTPARGIAVVVDGDPNRRAMRARPLLNAGYEVRFAADPGEADSHLSDARSRLALFSGDLPAVHDAVRHNAAGRPSLIRILLSAPKDLAVDTLRLADLPNTAVTDAFAPSDNAIFVANELANPGTHNKRGSRRLLYATTVAFRGTGLEHDDIAFSYNLSAGGLYVRTFAPPERDDLWIELLPPRSSRRVRLECKVVWRRAWGSAHAANVPPGFGVEIIDATRTSMADWLDGYRALSEAFRPLERAPEAASS